MATAARMSVCLTLSPHLCPAAPTAMSTVFNFTFVPWFRSVAPYIHMHRGKTFVIGMAGEAVAAGKLQHIAQDLALIQSMGVRIVLVHGFRPQVTEQLKAKGHEARYSHGMRITDEVALDSAQEAAGQLRYEIEAAFSQGLPNTPMAGSTVRVISGNFITARPIGILDGVDFQHTGLVRKVDVGGILQLIEPFEKDGTLVKRDRTEIERDIANYTIVEHDGVIFACAALYPYPEARTGEMAALTVSPQSQGQGDGEKILKRIEHRARAMGLESIFVLTTRTMHWFLKRGFVQSDADWLPEARKRKYNWDRKSLVFVKKLG
jgi:N-acetylglutamate synthase-like GNAT family acetyltransferase